MYEWLGRIFLSMGQWPKQDQRQWAIFRGNGSFILLYICSMTFKSIIKFVRTTKISLKTRSQWISIFDLKHCHCPVKKTFVWNNWFNEENMRKSGRSRLVLSITELFGSFQYIPCDFVEEIIHENHTLLFI